MVVLTHQPPDDWPRGGVPIHFVSGVEAAMAKAQELAGDKHVSVAGATATREVLDAGLLDEIVISLVPVILGEGIPWFAGAKGPVRPVGPGDHRRPRRDAPALPGGRSSRLGRVADLPDLSRYDDWLAWLTERAASDPDARCAWVGGFGGHGRVRRVVRPRRRRAVHAGHVDRGLHPLAGRGAGGLRRARRLGGPRARVAGRAAVLRQPPGPARPAARADPPHRPARLGPVGPALAPRHPPARDADRAARPGGAGRPRGGGRPRGAGGRGLAVAPAPVDRRVAGQPRDRPRSRRGGHRLLPALRAAPRWSGWSGPEHCPARHDFGLRYLREDLPAEVADRVESLVPGAARPGRCASCPATASPGSTSCWLSGRSGPGTRAAAGRGSRTRGSARRRTGTARASPRRSARAGR